MFNRVCPALLFVGLVLCSRTVLAEDSSSSGFYITPEVGYVLPTNGKVDDTVFLGAKLGYGFTDNWAAETESGYMEYKIDFSNNVKDVDLQSVPVMANLVYSDCAFGTSRWYAYGGVGVNFNDLDETVGDIHADDTVAWQVGLGLEQPFMDHMAGVLDVRYFQNDPSISTSAADANKIDLNAVMFNIGLKFQ